MLMFDAGCLVSSYKDKAVFQEQGVKETIYALCHKFRSAAYATIVVA